MKRSYQDRRTMDRRHGFDLKVISTLGTERRSQQNRQPERRPDWKRLEGTTISAPNYV